MEKQKILRPMKKYKQLVNDLYPLHRTILSYDMYKSHELLKTFIGEQNYTVSKYASGTPVLDWQIPDLYDVKEAYIENQTTGERILDFKDSSLHILSYSKPVDKVLSFDELKQHLYTAPGVPDGIPWKFSYYDQSRWAFCLSQNQLEKLDTSAKYRVKIVSSFIKDYLLIGEAFIRGQLDDEILILSNVCHPYQVNDSITGVVNALYLYENLKAKTCTYSYRFLFLPEMIGTITYVSQNSEAMKNVKYGFFSEMLGNDDSLKLQHSFVGDSLLDKAFGLVADKHKALPSDYQKVVKNDEFVLNAPGIDIPAVSVSRSRKVMDSFDGYHTSHDNPSNLNWDRINEALDYTCEAIDILDKNFIPKRTYIGPPFYSKTHLWDKYCTKMKSKEEIDAIIFYIDNKRSILEIAHESGIAVELCYMFIHDLLELGYVTKG